MNKLLPSAMLLALGALTLPPSPAAAQGGNRPVQQPVARVWINGMEVPAPLQEMLFTRRARLGITVNLLASPNDSVGATVSAVTPGGPAFKAGLQSGDIIVRLDGNAVAQGPRPASAEPDQSLPGLRLIELASRLEPHATVAIEYKRGPQRRTVSLVTGNEPILLGDLLEGERRQVFSFTSPDSIRRLLAERADPVANSFAFSPLARFSDLELAPLNPELGSYFGATEGVLVVRAGERSSLGLKGGDVLLAIDGRAVTTPAAALRILRSYETGETIRFEVLRNRQRQALSATVERD
jgi:S1-C subfamily serine protease